MWSLKLLFWSISHNQLSNAIKKQIYKKEKNFKKSCYSIKCQTLTSLSSYQTYESRFIWTVIRWQFNAKGSKGYKSIGSFTKLYLQLKNWHPCGRSKWRKHLRYIEIENQGAGKYSPFVLKYCIYSSLVSNQHILYNKCKQEWTIVTGHVAQAYCNTGFSTEDTHTQWQEIRQSCSIMAK